MTSGTTGQTFHRRKTTMEKCKGILCNQKTHSERHDKEVDEAVLVAGRACICFPQLTYCISMSVFPSRKTLPCKNRIQEGMTNLHRRHFDTVIYKLLKPLRRNLCLFHFLRNECWTLNMKANGFQKLLTLPSKLVLHLLWHY